MDFFRCGSLIVGILAIHQPWVKMIVMKLIGSLTSPYVRKVRVVLAEKKLDYEWILQDVWSSDDILQFNPLGKVPCLVMEGGEAVFDSRVIVEYLDTLSPVGKLIPASGRERAEVLTWQALCDGILDALVAIRLENTWEGRQPEQRSTAWVARQMTKVESGLKAMSLGLVNKNWCYGNHFGLADVSVGCVLSYLDFRFPELAWRQTYPHLQAYHQKLLSRPSFTATQPPVT